MYPKYAHSYHKNIYSTVFIAALFIISRTWKQPRCPSTKEWIKKMWYIYTVEYYSVVKILWHSAMEMDGTRNSILFEGIQTQNQENSTIHSNVDITYKAKDNQSVVHNTTTKKLGNKENVTETYMDSPGKGK